MAWTVNYLSEARRIDIAISGEMSPTCLRKATDTALDLVEQHGCFAVLVNCRELAQAPSPSAVQKLPEYYASRNADRRLRIAVVLSQVIEGQGTSSFYKMAARRHDYVVQLFDEIIDAIEWLERETAVSGVS